MQMPSGEYIFSEFPDGTIGGFPAWMTDPAIGSVSSAGSARPSAAALAELRVLLDSVRTGSLVGNAFLQETHLENLHAIQENQGTAAVAIAVSPPSPDHPDNAETTRSNRRPRRSAAPRGSRSVQRI
jgi:hypothetical protein